MYCICCQGCLGRSSVRRQVCYVGLYRQGQGRRGPQGRCNYGAMPPQGRGGRLNRFPRFWGEARRQWDEGRAALGCVAAKGLASPTRGWCGGAAFSRCPAPRTDRRGPDGGPGARQKVRYNSHSFRKRVKRLLVSGCTRLLHKRVGGPRPGWARPSAEGLKERGCEVAAPGRAAGMQQGWGLLTRLPTRSASPPRRAGRAGVGDPRPHRLVAGHGCRRQTGLGRRILSL